MIKRSRAFGCQHLALFATAPHFRVRIDRTDPFHLSRVVAPFIAGGGATIELVLHPARELVHNSEGPARAPHSDVATRQVGVACAERYRARGLPSRPAEEAVSSLTLGCISCASLVTKSSDPCSSYFASSTRAPNLCPRSAPPRLLIPSVHLHAPGNPGLATTRWRRT